MTVPPAVLACSVLPLSICKLTLLFIVREPVLNSPAGTSTIPPPLFEQKVMYALMAVALFVLLVLAGTPPLILALAVVTL